MPTLMNERARLACFGMPIVALGVYGIAHNAAKWEGNVYEVKASAATSLVVGWGLRRRHKLRRGRSLACQHPLIGFSRWRFLLGCYLSSS